MNLSSLQAMLYHAIHTADSSASPLQTSLRPMLRGSLSQSLDLYIHNHYHALVQSLEKTYPVCLQLVGEDFFVAMAQRYIALTPSRSYTLHDYGRDFANFIAQFGPAASVPYLADIARLEWAWQHAYYAEDPQPIATQIALLEDLDATTPVALTLPLHVTLLSSFFPILDIWQQHQINTDQAEWSIDFNQGEIYLIIWREDLAVSIETLNPLTWQKLAQLRSSLPLNINTLDEWITYLVRGWLVLQAVDEVP